MGNSGSTLEFDSSSIAVVGMAGRFPEAQGVEEFWRNLRDGVESIRPLSDEELEEAGMPRRDYTHPRFVKAAAVIEGEDLFDAPFFGYNPREAEALDPQHRLFLECAWEALENSGYDPETYPGAVGVYAGSGVSSYLFRIFSSNELLHTVGPHQALIANVGDYLTTRVSYKLNLKGPSINVQTACSTSLVAVHLACQSLLNGECSMALAGGVTVNTPQKTGYFYEEGAINSPDGHCRTFDASAQGTVGGNGLGVVVLKRFEDAIREGDQILAVIRGSAINNDGSLKVGFTAPSVAGQAEVIREAQALAGVEPDTITYIEAHGTATPLGDPIEMEALTEAFRAATGKKNFCAVGSVKTNVGHLDAAAGITGLIKTVLALKHRQIPPSLNYESPNPKIDFENSPFYVNTRLREWESNDHPRRAGVSSFGIGGTNAHVVLEEAPELEDSGTSRPAQLLVISARTDSALEAATTNLLGHLKANRDANLADVAFTLQAGRKAFGRRRTLVCEDAEDAVATLEAMDAKRVLTRAAGSANSPVVFMFSGQGAQYVRMCLGLYSTEPEFRRHLDFCAEALKPHLGLDLRDLLYPAAGSAEEDVANQLRQTRITQPALFAVEYALAKLWMSWGVTPRSMIGHSLGEYVAACLAGVFSVEDALKLVAARGRLMQEMPEGSMLAVPLPASELLPLLGEELSLAAVNAPTLCVVSGPQDSIARLQSLLRGMQVEGRPLHTSHAFHSAMMEPMLDRFAELVEGVSLSAPAIPYVSNVTGTFITDEQATDPAYWVAHLRRPVLFAEGVQELLRQPGSILLEVGPGQTLASLARRQPGASAQTILASTRQPHEQQADGAYLLGTLGRLWAAGVKVDWAGFYAHEQRRRIALPTYPFERKRYWIEGPGIGMGAESAPRRLHKRSEMADWFYAPAWNRTRTPVAPEPSELAGSYLIFADGCGLGEGLAEGLVSDGRDVVTVSASELFETRGADEYSINPRRAEDYERLLHELEESGRLPGVIVNLWGVTPEGLDDAATNDEAVTAGALGFYSLLHLAQAIGARNLTDDLQIIAVTSGAQEVTGEESLRPEKALALGPCRVIPQEYPNVNCRSVDVIAPRPGTRASRELVAALMAETTTGSSEASVAYRGRHRWVEVFEPLSIKTDVAGRTRLREGGVYLITGGLGRVGLALAAHLARNFKAKLAL
ncbi:MAG: hypothetical protein QOH49_1395, partial [Acidobacteriota bacterium]|nr:hypothetical protein [Acidobacteriota bacterium]